MVERMLHDIRSAILEPDDTLDTVAVTVQIGLTVYHIEDFDGPCATTELELLGDLDHDHSQ